MPESYEVKTKEFHWNGHDGSIRNGGLYSLLYSKPFLSFSYDTGYYTDQYHTETIFTLNGEVLNLTVDQVSEVVAYIEDNALEDPWEIEVKDPRLLFEQVTSLNEIEVHYHDTWMPFLTFLELDGIDDTKIAFYLMKSRTITNRNHSYELFTDETKTNDLKGFLPTIQFENPSMGKAYKWLFKLKKTDDTHAEFEITNTLKTVRGVGIMDSANPDFYGFRFTGDAVATNELILESPNEKYQAILFVDSKGIVTVRLLNTTTDETKDFITYDEYGKLHLPYETYLQNDKVLTEKDRRTMGHIDLYSHKTSVNNNTIYYGSYENRYLWFTGNGSTISYVNVSPWRSPSNKTTRDFFMVIENKQYARPLMVKITGSDGNEKEILSIPINCKLNIRYRASSDEYFYDFVSCVPFTPPTDTQGLEDAIFMGVQEIFIDELTIGGI